MLSLRAAKKHWAWNKVQHVKHTAETSGQVAVVEGDRKRLASALAGVVVHFVTGLITKLSLMIVKIIFKA